MQGLSFAVGWLAAIENQCAWCSFLIFDTDYVKQRCASCSSGAILTMNLESIKKPAGPATPTGDGDSHECSHGDSGTYPWQPSYTQ